MRFTDGKEKLEIEIHETKRIRHTQYRLEQ